MDCQKHLDIRGWLRKKSAMHKNIRAILPVLGGAILAILLAAAPLAQALEAPVLRLEPLREHPHNPEHFTQGLFFHAAALYESTGLYGKSRLARKDPQTGQTLAQTELGAGYFGEGATLAGGRIYVLTWQEHTAFVFNPDDFKLEGWFTYSGEGWGLTYDGRRLIRSDGSDTLYFHNLDGTPQGSLAVRDNGKPVARLNELEWIPGQNLILANIWRTERIAAIDATSGEVTFWLDLAALVPPDLRGDPQSVPNGIALAPDGRSLWLTGKLWPVIYEVAWPPAAMGAAAGKREP